MTDLTPAEMREAAKRLRESWASYMPTRQAMNAGAGADALDALAAISDMLPGPRTWVDNLRRDINGVLFPRHIDADKVAGVIAGMSAYREVSDES